MKSAFLVAASSAAIISTAAAAQGVQDEQGASAATEQTAAEREPVAASRVIVVTATRRAESINDIPVSVQAFDGEQLDNLRVTDTEDLTAVAPSFTVSRGYQGVPIYTLRGIGFNTINLSATSTVGTYVDEVALAYPFMNTGPVYDLERVEVLKGPQGTLYGRNTTGGLVNFITAKPTTYFEAGIEGELGNYSTVNSEGYISGPLSDSIQARFAFRTEDSFDGWQESISRDETLGENHRYGARLTIAAQPADGMDLELAASGWINNSDTLAAQAIGFTPNTDPVTGASGVFNAPGLPEFVANNFPTEGDQADWAPDSRRRTDIGTGLGLDEDLQENNEFYSLRALAELELSDRVNLISLTGFNHVERDATFDWSGAPYEVLIQNTVGEIDSFSQELRVEYDVGPAQILFGGYYAHDDILDTNRTLLGENANPNFIRFLGLNGLPGSGGPAPIDIPFLNPFGYTPTEIGQAFRTYRDEAEFQTEVFSLFANADVDLADTLRLTAGVRYTDDTQDYVGCSRDVNGNMLPNVNVVNRFLFLGIYGELVDPISQGECNTFDPETLTFGPVESSLEEDNVAWRGALAWDATNDVLVFGSVSRGFKSGSTPVNAASIAEQNFPAVQEQLTAYELGVKAGMFDNAAQLNVAGFYYDYKDKQLSSYFPDPIYTALSRLVNVPTSNAWGIDGDVTVYVGDELTISAAATYLQTEIEAYDGINAAGQPETYDGSEFPYSPEFSGSLTVNYDAPVSSSLGMRITANGRYQTEVFTTLENEYPYTIDDYAIVNASAALYGLDTGWEVSVWGRNLTDTYYWSAVASNANTVVRFPGRTRTFGLSVSYDF
ncbi:TonB-dependent receptor [Pacificimonas flava]|uniref:TonB-dependent receptor n=2 Tax=Pacificimonas TaxID=1960290 RepID=A0A219B0N7_9SPHN|nr:MULTISPECIES: TonB-dependent receptor [Pacificimonas]MBZ6379655.1 TonB-dependent receptor [Pacificimonas aurantium]OWV31880.1 TonB-dependent receptor [Pacificimonas flava]